MTDVAPITLIGCGNMGGALLHRWRQSIPSERFTVVEPNGLKIGVQTLAHVRDLPDRVQGIVILATKPQILDQVAQNLTGRLGAEAVLVSVLAGVTTVKLQSVLGCSAVIRAMPNTPCALGHGAVGLFATPQAVDWLADVQALFALTGQVVTLSDETQMHAVTALSGSGPAYVFALVEALAVAGEKAGLAAEDAKALAVATVTGAAALLEQDGADPVALRQAVTSPGGTTQAGLAALCQGDALADLMYKTVAAAAKRSRELAGEAE